MRLSQRQRDILAAMVGTEQAGAIPLYMEHIPRKNSFDSDGEIERFMQNLERRGLITIENRWFLRLTNKGAQIVTPNVLLTTPSKTQSGTD